MKEPSSPHTTPDWSAGIRCWIEHSGEIVIGPGRAELFERIDRLHSIRAAASEMGMSYRRAWLLVASANRRAGEVLIETAIGGKRGGGATLTPKGRELLAMFQRLDRELLATASASLKKPPETRGPDHRPGNEKSAARRRKTAL